MLDYKYTMLMEYNDLTKTSQRVNLLGLTTSNNNGGIIIADLHKVIIHTDHQNTNYKIDAAQYRIFSNLINLAKPDTALPEEQIAGILAHEIYHH